MEYKYAFLHFKLVFILLYECKDSTTVLFCAVGMLVAKQHNTTFRNKMTESSRCLECKFLVN